MSMQRNTRDRVVGRTAVDRIRSQRAGAGTPRLVATVVVGLLGMMMLVLAGCSAPAEAQEPTAAVVERGDGGPRRVPVTTVVTETRAFVEYGEYVGEARGVSEVRLTAAAPGRVTALSAEQGDIVAAGASLAEIAPDRARTTYETAVLNERLARETWEREQRFLDQGNSFQLKVDQAHLAYLQARSALLDARELLDSQLAVSPIAGTVVRRHVRLHDDLEPGDPTFDIADMSRIRVTVGVPEADIAGVRELRSAEVVFSASPRRSFIGVPASFARTRSDRTLTYEVDVEIDNAAGDILLGQTARVRLALRELPDVVVVPSSAILVRGADSVVMVVENDTIREVPVETGPSNTTETVVLSGLGPGERLVTDGFNRLADGAAVDIVQ